MNWSLEMAKKMLGSKKMLCVALLFPYSFAYCSVYNNHTTVTLEKLTQDPLVFKNIKVITDVVGVSTKKYVDSFKEGEVPRPDESDMPSKDQYRGMGFPVSTPGLKPGNIGPNEGNGFNISQILRPIAIVGDDDVSRGWLKRYAQKLKERRATVFVVNVSDSDSFKVLESLAPGVYFQASNGQRFIDEYNVTHYPFYVSAETGVLRNAN